MTNKEIKMEPKKRRWGAIIVTTVITIIVTLAAAWYTIYRSEKQAVLAEAERVRSVRDNLVSIIEEHVINRKNLDFARLVRLIGVKSRSEELTSTIVARDLVEQAEYNILNSRYLDFKQKDEYKVVFDEFYKSISPKDYSLYKDIPHAELLNQVAKNIREGNTKTSLDNLNQFVEKYIADLAEIERKSTPKTSFFKALLEKPTFVIFMVIYLIIAFTFMPYYMRMLRRSRERLRE